MPEKTTSLILPMVLISFIIASLSTGAALRTKFRKAWTKGNKAFKKYPLNFFFFVLIVPSFNFTGSPRGRQGSSIISSFFFFISLPLKRESSRLAASVGTLARRETSSSENTFSGLDRNNRIILTLAEEPKSFSKAVFIFPYYHSYLSVTTAPAASSLAFNSSAVFLSAPSLTIIGALSVISLASLSPKPSASLKTFITWIFWTPASLSSMLNELFSSTASPPAVGAAATATAWADTPNFSSKTLTRSDNSKTLMASTFSIMSLNFADISICLI